MSCRGTAVGLLLTGECKLPLLFIGEAVSLLIWYAVGRSSWGDELPESEPEDEVDDVPKKSGEHIVDPLFG